MTDSAQNITLDILKRIQADIAKMDGRLDRMEELIRKVRRDYAGMLVMMRAVTGDFDQRVSDIEERVAALEASERPSTI
jgi:hypothetical protein